MTKEELAAQLTGREIGNEMTPAEESLALKNGLVVIFGASDDLCEFRGALNDESGAPGEIFILNGKVSHGIERDDEESLERYGLLESVKAALESAIRVKALWCVGKNGPAWTYEINRECAAFDVMEDGEVWCRGIVINYLKA